MTVRGLMFLAIRLALGLATLAALIEVIRARPYARREVRRTVAQDAIPRSRVATLAGDAAVTVSPEPARSAHADRRGLNGSAGRPVSLPISVGASDSSGTRLATATLTTARLTPAPVALLDPPDAAESVAAPTHSGPCAEELRLADERCELATRAQAQAVAAADALLLVQRTYDTHLSRSTAAAEAADPLAVRGLKEEAQRAFRASSGAPSSPQAAEAAARTWLQQINRINREAAAAGLTAQREGEAAAALGATLERLSHEAETARFGADLADAACRAAKVAVAACDERTKAGPAVARPTPPPPTEPVLSGMDHEALGIALEEGTAPRIFRLLRGDPDAMAALVASLAGDDPDELPRWKVALTGLLDAILADAIEQSFLRFPRNHSFWGPYTEEQRRDITRALAALGHRVDGHGGWIDERLPSQRELSLALAYAGLDPIRVRQWPNEKQTAELFRDVEVAADEYLAGAAGDLTLAEMVEMLGRRADSMVDLWNQWARIRPLLLEEA